VNNRSSFIADLGELLKVIGVSLTAFFLLTPTPAWAQSPLKAKAIVSKAKASGEVVSARQTTINGFTAISGATVFTENRIRTGEHGAAVINLGNLGRIEFGPETDMTLRLSETGIGGELRSNHVVVSARAGAAISINTAESVVTTDGRQPAVLTIYANGARARVVTHLGAANVVSTGENSPAGAKELAQPPRGVGLRRAGLVAGSIGAAGVGHTVVQAATAKPDPPTFTGLFKAGVNYSVTPKPGRVPGPNEPFETSITCRDGDNIFCRKKSSYKPERP
jgi:hypothetical protein